ncbi:hypothetical protein HJC23_010919 [Cyclotella cryptica]|uniref:Uncharacterized protein n=1 Tax=Cyclotella cryptica TaxID=29204 RepID=A0ABD3Q9M3_9STRA|eukprot:CCRYP_007544-RA/>CCRYP_007544-RA protein AED:0.46 eAED:0.46 QI:0/-1/0/1/-1/1/1/0/218
MGRGKLVFKGEVAKAKKKTHIKSSIQSKNPVAPAPPNHPPTGNSSDNKITEHAPDNPAASQTLPSPALSTGNGLISTSGTVVTGHGTTFKTDLRAGDAIIARTPRGEEMRVVTMVLSQISISISSAFTVDIKTPAAYQFIVKPRDIRKEKEERAQRALADQEAVERQAMGTYGNKGEIIYREKTEHGSYRIRRETANTEMNRSDLLNLRSKKKSDRYC